VFEAIRLQEAHGAAGKARPKIIVYERNSHEWNSRPHS
jgi:hypothetical protein